MIRFLTRRLLLAIPILLGVTVVVFITIKLVPGNPVATLLGPNATAQARVALTARLGLDRPLPVQYLDWVWAVVHGNLGTSISMQQSAGHLALTAFANTMLLVVVALVLALIGGVAGGVVMALAPRSHVARGLSGLTMLFLSAPQYSIALLLVIVAVKTSAFPTGGMHATGTTGIGDLLSHMLLPSIAAALVPMGIVARMFAVALGEVLEQEFVAAMRARGLAPAAIVRHAIHNAMPSLLTITGLQIGYLLGGVLFVETIFNWPGIGQQLYMAISSRDEPLIEAGVLLTATALVLTNVLVDTLHALIDPRVRA